MDHKPHIELAPHDAIDSLSQPLAEFMRKIFDLQPQEYLVTDDTQLPDFVPFTDLNCSREERRVQIEAVKHRIARAYGLSEVPDNLVALLRLIIGPAEV